MNKEITINDIKNEEVKNALFHLTNLEITDLSYIDIQKCFNTLLNACIKADKYDDKETPKKPMKIKTNYMEAYGCPNCRHSFEGFSYCRFCGQRLEVKWKRNIF